MKSHTSKIVETIVLDTFYVKWTARESCLAREEMWIHWLIDQGLKGLLDIPNRNSFDYYVEKETFLFCLEKLYKNMQANLEQHIKIYNKKKIKLLELGIQVKEITKKHDKKKILVAFKDFLEAFYDFGYYIFTPWSVIFFAEPLVLKHFPDQLNVIMSLEQPIEHLKMQHDLFYMLPQELCETYAWLNMYSPHDSPYTEKDFEKMKKETKQEEIEKTFSQFKETKEKFNDFLKTITNKEIKKAVEIVHAYAFLKTDRIDTVKKALWYLRSFYEYLAALSPQLTLQKTVHLSVAEIETFLYHGTLPTNMEIRAANKAVYYYHNGGLDILTDQKEVEKLKKRLEQQTKKSKEVKGIIACKGKVQGKVKIIAHSKDLVKIKKGDIFIAKYTFPSFTSAMLKCAAIITDDGGITSHAAILSREYNIPCIIGTSIATTIFKDHDLVEVDANKGIVRKLS